MLPVMLAAAVAVGISIGFLVYRFLSGKKLKGTREQSDQLLRDAFQEADRRKREMLTEAREEIHRLRQDAEREIKDRRAELQRAERKIEQKEENLDARMDSIVKREEDFRNRQEDLSKKLEEIESIRQKHVERLEEIAMMSREQAKGFLLQEVEQEAAHSIGLKLKELEEKARRESERRSREIVVSAIQRCAVDHTSEMSVSVVSLPSDEMKGRIIGREGRNIRAFETFTGVDLIVDDTPEAVTLSSFDPVRREVARLSLERLVLDGRIHPARIEEIVEKAQKDVEVKILEFGEEALLETGIKSMHPELVKIIGQLKYRSSYGQNALLHSLEVSHLAGIMAAELGIDEQLARRAGLLHDIGKAVDHQVEGPHALIGRDIAKRFGEIPEVVNAIAAHHEDEEMISVYDVLVSAADAVSASRPGARRESLESYIKRLEKLETLAKTFKGVTKAYAIQAGREVRVMVAPNSLDDGAIHKLAYDIARKIEGEMKYPGQIKVIVIRETRSVEFAK